MTSLRLVPATSPLCLIKRGQRVGRGACRRILGENFQPSAGDARQGLMQVLASAVGTDEAAGLEVQRAGVSAREHAVRLCGGVAICDLICSQALASTLVIEAVLLDPPAVGIGG